MTAKEILALKHFSEFQGNLYKNNNSFRENWMENNRIIPNVHLLKAALRAGGYTELGGYTIAFCFEDGDCYSYEGLLKIYPEIVSDWMHGYSRPPIICIPQCDIDESTYDSYICTETNKPIFSV